MLALKSIDAQIEDRKQKMLADKKQLAGIKKNAETLTNDLASFDAAIERLNARKQKLINLSEMMADLGKKDCEKVFSELFADISENNTGPNMNTPLEPKNEDIKIFNYSKDDLPYQLVYNAYSGSSYTPSKIAKKIADDYFQEMEEINIEFTEFCKYDPSVTLEIKQDLTNFKDGYLKCMKAKLEAQSKTISSLVTGAGNFPTERNQKKLDIAKKRLEEMFDYKRKQLSKLRKKYNPAISQPISSDDKNALELLKDRLEADKIKYEKMKMVNAICRKKKPSKEEVQRLGTLFDELGIKTKTKDITFGKKDGYPSYAMRNHYQDIKRQEARIELLLQEEEHRKNQLENNDKCTSSYLFEGGEIIENYEDNRLEVYFDKKPSADMRSRLKGSGFKWTPSKKAWQRQLNDAARIAAAHLLGVTIQSSSGHLCGPEARMELDS